MIVNINTITNSGRITSVGQYNQGKQCLELWVYATRFIEENGAKYAEIPDFDTSICRDAKKVLLVDNDWDYRYEMTYNAFKKIPVKNGVRKVCISKLSPLK